MKTTLLSLSIFFLALPGARAAAPACVPASTQANELASTKIFDGIKTVCESATDSESAGFGTMDQIPALWALLQTSSSAMTVYVNEISNQSGSVNYRLVLLQIAGP